MAQIVSANVGGVVAGQVVIPSPESASYATWPDILKKTTSDVIDLFIDNYRNREQEEDEASVPAPAQSPTMSRPQLFGGGIGMLLAVGAIIYFARKLF